MTEYQKKLWNSLPVGEWIERDTIDWDNRYGGRSGTFQRSISWMYKRQLIELKFFGDGKQYVRRKTIEEIQQIPLNIFKGKS